jgi:hypothetical protein
MNMKVPTIKELESIFVKHHLMNTSMVNPDTGEYECAKEIQALFTPTYKPLSELAGDRESCEKICKMAIDGLPLQIEDRGAYLFLNCHRTELYIHYDGVINATFQGSYDYSVGSIFKLVDFIRSLGYSA